MKISDIHQLAEALVQNIGSVIVGKEKEIRLVLAALLSGGHVLLEDMPGTGKTTLAKSLAASLDCSFSRIQFTPDLLPSDITGMRIYHQQTGEFRFIKGPAFTNILLADEINRATPRTQSALLECMEERQITEDGSVWTLDPPFFVIATQNPVETQGTFPLPEAQLDRFAVRLSLGYPDHEESLALLKRFITSEPLRSIAPVLSVGQICEAMQLTRQCAVSTDVMRYIIKLCEAARNPDLVRLGPSPRAMLTLMRCAQAYAAMAGRDYVIPDDVKALTVPVLAHRVILRGIHQQFTQESFIGEVLAHVSVPTEARA